MSEEDEKAAEEYIESVRRGIRKELWPLLEKDREIMEIAFVRGIEYERAKST